MSYFELFVDDVNLNSKVLTSFCLLEIYSFSNLFWQIWYTLEVNKCLLVNLNFKKIPENIIALKKF